MRPHRLTMSPTLKLKVQSMWHTATYLPLFQTLVTHCAPRTDYVRGNILCLAKPQIKPRVPHVHTGVSRHCQNLHSSLTLSRCQAISWFVTHISGNLFWPAVGFGEYISCQNSTGRVIEAANSDRTTFGVWERNIDKA